jgi:hypothetical protein
VNRLLAACGLGLLAGCLTERPRPAPPTLALSLNKTTVRSRSTPAPDTLVVNVRAEDEDGIDSVWVQLAQEAPVGADGLLDPVLEGPFRVIVPAGLGSGTVLPVKVQARDVVGFRSERDTSVTVGP